MISLILDIGMLTIMFSESSNKPKKQSFVVGPSVFSSANGTPNYDKHDTNADISSLQQCPESCLPPPKII
ncbi:hypothetical protein DPMN_047734 [Dreissena polymorpha]|uniref:Uncharacterized protein n=1 Tax=Dreissena polymorpha TaxID=45954 RepID=A0A9D4D893_DREPO|nr:hypothetical protein DPMN_047734 [Dreissena polymorpha]